MFAVCPSGLRPAYALGEDRNLTTSTSICVIRAGCARRTRWARIATVALAGHRPDKRLLRPAYALGEDRNVNSVGAFWATCGLRPAYALGEDRNNP